MAGFASAAGRKSTVELDAQIAGDAEKTRFVAFLSRSVDFHIFTLTDPYRIVVDLPQTDIQVPSGPGRGLIYSARAGLFAEGKSRIVIDLTEPAAVEKAEVLPERNNLPARLVIDLKKISVQAFLAASEAQAHKAREANAEASTERRPSAATKEADSKPVIVVDPGHGGVDGGAVSPNGTIEKNVTLEFARALKQELDKIGRYKVILTRTIDVFVPLDERAEIAVGLKAALFISIHADSLDPKSSAKMLKEVHGATIYTLSEKASDNEASAIAERENKADLVAGLTKDSAPEFSEELDHILHDLDVRIKQNRSHSYSNALITRLKGKMAFNVKPQRSADFRVLKASGVPAVLFELGYLSHPDDEKLLSSPEWRTKIAGEVASVTDTFLSERQAQLPF